VLKNFLSNITKKYGQFLLVGLSLFVLSITLMGRAGVLTELLKQGPSTVFAGPCPQGGCNGGDTTESYPQCGGTCNEITYDGSHTVMVDKTTHSDGSVSYSCNDTGPQQGQCGNNPPTCGEQPAQYPQCGGTCNGTTYDSSHTVNVTKNVDGACNVTWDCQDQGAIDGQCGNTTQTCNETPNHYTQCGGDCNGTNYDSSHTVDVNKNVDGSCNVSWSCNDLGAIDGQCGNTSCQPTENKYPQCGGTTGLEAASFDRSHTYEITETTNCDGSKSFAQRDLGNLGQ